MHSIFKQEGFIIFNVMTYELSSFICNLITRLSHYNNDMRVRIKNKEEKAAINPEFKIK